MTTRSPASRAALAGFVLLTAGCGGGSIAVFGASQSQKRTVNTRPAFSDLDVVIARTSPALLQFVARDGEGDSVDVAIRWRVGGGAWSAATVVVGTFVADDGAGNPKVVDVDARLDGLQTDGSGVRHSKLWDFASQLGAGLTKDVEIEVRLVGTSGAGGATSGTFDLGNDAPLVDPAIPPPVAAGDEGAGTLPLSFLLSDTSSDEVTVTVEFARVVAGLPEPWQPARRAGDSGATDDPALTNVVAPAVAEAVTFFWDSLHDLPAEQADVRLRFTVDDGVDSSLPVETPTFRVDNNGEPIAFLDGSALVGNPDGRGTLPVPFTVSDPEAEAVDLLLQWAPFGESFPALPATRAELVAALADPKARRELQLATERPRAWSGAARVPSSASQLRLDLDPAAQSALAAGGWSGRSIELLAAGNAWSTAASRWPAFSAPGLVAVAARSDRRHALLLRAPAGQPWRIDALDLATGVVAATPLATGPDLAVATAFALDADEQGVLVAASLGGAVTLDRFDLATAAVTRVVAAGDAGVAAPVRGLLSLGPARALVTAEDALAGVDWSGSPTRALVLARGLAEPGGLLRDPTLAGGLIVAERLATNGAGGIGRLLRIDAATLARAEIGLASGAIERPSALAWDEESGRLLVTTDLASDGLFELQEVALGGVEGGAARVVAAGLAAAPAALAIGDARLRLAAAPATGTLHLVGGVVQRRAIAGFDPAGPFVTPDLPFAPPPAPGAAWRIVEEASPFVATAEGRDGRFVWETRPIGRGGRLALRIVPFDDEVGFGQELATPREMSAALVVAPLAVAGSASTPHAVAVACGDLDRDGDLDVAVADDQNQSLRLFRQVAPATFSALATLGGAATTNGPSAVVLADLNGDGRVDVASSNRVASSVTLFFQGAGASFPSAPSVTIAAAAGIAAPNDLVAADLDRDGRVDLAVANGATNDVLVLWQDPAGTFGVARKQKLGGAGVTDGPVALAADDVDGDLRADLLVVDELGNDVALFLQQPDATFPTAPGLVLAGNLASPRDVATLDADGDGDRDVAVPSYDSHRLALYRQVAPQQFVEELLASTVSLALPTAVAAADVDRDGDDDLVVTTEFFGRVALFAQSPAGTFGSGPTRDPDLEITLKAGAAPVALALGEVDGDGLLDVVVAAPGNGETALLATQQRPRLGPQPELTLVPPRLFGRPYRVVVGDVDGDGHDDVATLAVDESVAPVINVFLQTSPGVVSTAPDLVVGGLGSTNDVRELALADLDGDGDLDLVCATALGAGKLLLFRNDPSLPARFVAAPADVLSLQSTGSNPAAIVAGDWNGDGATDLAVADEGTNRVALFVQSGGLFPPVPSLFLGGFDGPLGMACADVDRDGFDDLVVTNQFFDGLANVGELRLYPGAAGGITTTPLRLFNPASPMKRPKDVAAGDVDGDGRLDLVVTTRTDRDLVVWKQAPAPAPARQFSLAQRLLATQLEGPVGVIVRDLDGDGDADLACANNLNGARGIALFLQRSDGRYPSAADRLLLNAPSGPSAANSLAVADFDGDGTVDLVAAYDAPAASLAFYFGGGR